MILKKMTLFGVHALALALVASGYAQAGTNLVTNGDFSSFTSTAPGGVPGGLGLTTTVTDWSSANNPMSGNPGTNFLFAPGTADTTGSYATPFPFTLWGSNNGGVDVIPASSPAGGNFIGADGDPGYSSAISQTINGLTAGQSYTLGFYWAAGQESPYWSGPTTESWQVSLGSSTQSTSVVSNVSQGFVPWMYTTMTFVATSSSEALSFLAVGTPAGEPPISLLNDVSLVEVASVPEPSTLVLLGLGLLGIGGIGLRRRARSTSV